MAVFVVLPKNDDPILEANLKAAFPEGDILLVTKNQWLVSAPLTARQLCEKLGITAPPVAQGSELKWLAPKTASSAVIFHISNYFGRYSTEVWEWLKIKMEGANG